MDRPTCRTCGTTESLLRCAKCKTVFYCSISHQHIDWPQHKQLCRYLARQRLRLQQQQQNNNRLGQMSTSSVVVGASSSGIVGGVGNGPISSVNNVNMIGGVNAADFNNWGGLFGSASMDVTNSDGSVGDAGGVVEGGNFGNLSAADANLLAGVDSIINDLVLGTSEAEIMNSRAEIVAQSQHSNALFNNTLADGDVGGVGGGGIGGVNGDGGVGNIGGGVVSGGGSDNNVSYRVGRGDENYYQYHNMGANTHERNEELCRNIINDMNTYGLSVVDDFLGMEKGLSILNEVHGMYAAGVFRDGQVVSSNPSSGQEVRTIRGDKITWVTGVEQGCVNVGYLINQIDAVITRANTMKNNGKLGNYTIRERTKAMVACYPGSGAHYVMHVDNPNKDGRVITAIYYLNVNWDTVRSGGVLRIFPEHGGSIAEIEPKFDRLIFFWSDKRNPHEVQPAHRTRYAITVWYFDADEREAALTRCKQIRNKTNSNSNHTTNANKKTLKPTNNTQNSTTNSNSNPNSNSSDICT